VDPRTPEHHPSSLVQPLLDAGLPLEEICGLVTRLGFEAVVGDRRSLDERVLDLVGDHPGHVRAAWVETVRRMIEPAHGA
jgi:hypothetical protein